MSTFAAPSAKEVQEFQFKLLARLRLFNEHQKLPLKQSLNLVASASKFGLICVGTSTGFDVIETALVVELCAGVKKPAAEVTEFPRRSVNLGAAPTHLDISCDGQHLAVDFNTDGTTVVRIYDVTSLASQTERVVNEVRLPAPLQALSWNPGIPNLLAACLQDGSAVVCEFKNNSVDINSIPAGAQAMCLCWSPKGKQFVVGSRDGSLIQLKPELKIVKTIPPPQGGVSVVSVQWLSSLQYAVVYSGQGVGPNLVIVNTPRNQPVSYINFEDITYSNGETRLIQFYFIHQQTWNVLLVGSANSMEVGVLGLQTDWEQWQLEDAARAELPLSSTKQETHLVGMALDTSVQYNLPWGENQHLPAMPLLLLLSNEGLLMLYWTVNLLPGSTVICEPPTPLPDTSGLRHYTPPQQQQQAMSSPQNQVVGSPQATVAAMPVPLSLPAVASHPATFTPSPSQQPATTSQPAWTQPPPVLKPESKPPTIAGPGSWMASSTAPPTFISSITQSAFTAAAPAFSAPPPSISVPPPSTVIPPSSPAPQAFSVTTASGSPAFSFAPLQTTDLLNKPGAFVSSSTSAASTPLVSTASTPSAKLEIPAAVAVPPPEPSPVSIPSTPDPEVTEESQELKAMNDALIQDAIQGEILHFNQELAHVRQRMSAIKTNVLNKDQLEDLAMQTYEMIDFMQEVRDTTTVQDKEVLNLRSFLLEAFTYVENMKTRLRLQRNPDLLSLQSPQGLDPIQGRKLVNIKSNLQSVEDQLKYINRELATKWNIFQEANKENREVMQLPSLESIYQTMVMQNNVMLNQKTMVDELELKFCKLSRRELLNMMRVSRMVDESMTELEEDTELSKFAQDFLNLNLSKLRPETSFEELQKSVSNLSVSESALSLSNCSEVQSKMYSEKLMLLQEVFGDSPPKVLDTSKRWGLGISPLHSSMLPIVTTPPRTGSISSGQPLDQTISPKGTATSPVMNKTQTPPLKETMKSSEESKTSFSTPTSANSKSFNQSTIASQSTPVTSFSFNSNLATNSQISPQNAQKSPNTNNGLSLGVTSQNIPKSSPSVPFFSLSNTTVASQTATSRQSTLAASSTNVSKAFSFSSIATSQTPSPISSSATFVPNVVSSQAPASSISQPFAQSLSKPFSFSIPVSTPSTSAPPFSFGLGKTEPTKLFPSSTVSSPFKSTSNESSSFMANVSTTTSAPSSPLASLSSLVSGIEPLKPDNSPAKLQVSSESSTMKPAPTQPFVFQNPNSIENKVIPANDGTISTQKTNVFGVESKVEVKEPLTKAVEDHTSKSGDIKTQFGGAFTKISQDSPSQQPILGDTQTSKSGSTEPVKSNQSPKNVFNFSNTPTTNIFGGTKVATSSSQNQKLMFAGPFSSNTVPGQGTTENGIKPAEEVQSENISPIIEVSLTPSKSVSDPKSSLEKLSATKSITITKVEPSERKSPPVEGTQTEADSSAPLFGSLSIGSFTTPTKPSQSIFGGSSPPKSSITYDIAKPESEGVGSSDEQKSDIKSLEAEKQLQKTIPQTLFGGVTVTKTPPATSFTFSTSSLQSTPTPSESTQPQPSSGFSFGSKLPATPTTVTTTTTAVTTQASSTFSFAQASVTTQPSSSTFSFAVTATSAPTTATSTFGFGNLATGLSENKSKTEFSFGQQTQTPASTSASIFGGFSSKPVETASIFVQATDTTGENKSVFGQTPTSTIETKSLFGQPPSSITEAKNIFGQTPAISSETKSIFGQPTATTESAQPNFSFSLSSPTTTAQSSFFGSPATTTSSFFGQPICSPTSTVSSPFGQPSATPSAFGSTTPASPFGGPSAFGSKPVFGQSGGSFFGQSTGGFSSGGVSLFGGNSPGATSPSVFGSNTSQPASPFGQSSGGNGSVFGGGSFSSGGQTVGQTGFGTSAFQNKPAAFGSPSPPAFGAAPSFGGAPTFGGSAAFGSPPKLFGSPTASTPSTQNAFGGTSPQQSPTFENLATQNTMTFGNLAQNQSQGFGSMFSSPQANTPAPAFPSSNSGPVFGGSSFSSWR